MLLLVLPLLVLAFVSKFWFTLYLSFCFILALLFLDWSELGIKLSALQDGLRRTWHFFVLSLVVTTPVVWFLINRYLPEFWAHVSSRVEYTDLIQTLVGGVIIAPFIEEVIFRGLVQEQFSLMTNNSVALLVSSAMFAVVHWSSGLMLVVGVDLLLVFLDSIWFGLIYMKSRNTILSTLCHSLGNLMFILYAALVVGMML